MLGGTSCNKFITENTEAAHSCCSGLLFEEVSPGHAHEDLGSVCVCVFFASVAQQCFDLLPRRDKYERKVWEYWVDTKTTGTWEKEEKEEIVDHSLVEGKGNTLVLGGIEPGMPMDPENQLDEEDDEEEESDAGSDLEDAKPPSSNRGCKRRVKADEVEEERALEAWAQGLG